MTRLVRRGEQGKPLLGGKRVGLVRLVLSRLGQLLSRMTPSQSGPHS